MKKYSFILGAIFMGVSITNAQLPTGSYAPDFKLFEIDKVTGSIITADTIHLYEYLDAGKPTMLDFSATWCGPCWAYHNTHAMKNAYEKYGPNGTDELRILYIEGSDGNYSKLKGDAGSNSQGNWLSGTSYPIIPTNMSPNTKNVVSDYKITAFPTLYMVCPNRKVILIEGRPDSTKIYEYAKECPVLATNIDNNAAIFNLLAPVGVYACTNEVTPKIQLQNVGTSPLTSVDFTININGTTSNYTWTGNLNQYGITTVTLPKLTGLASSTHNYTITINNANGVPDTDAVLNEVSSSFELQYEPSADNLNETFTSSTFPNNGFWVSRKKGDGWMHYSGNNALYFFSYYCDSDTLYLPMLDLSKLSNPGISFDVANPAFIDNGTTHYDRLKVEISPACGTNWVSVYDKQNNLPTSTVNATNSNLGRLPSTSEWRRDGAVLTSRVNANSTTVRIRIIAIPNQTLGNIIWLDNIKVGEGEGVSVKEFGKETVTAIYPNPVQKNLYVRSDAEILQLEIFNIQGQRVKIQQTNDNVISTEDLSSGVYILRITNEKGASNHKFVKQY